ncbi:hypothetical protein AHiyo4_05860 [Arthrobacter sp. Hiyo4]|nr:hypothetical protein AHiyo4_05860 [Arthrobacter sp. Hiyo4]
MYRTYASQVLGYLTARGVEDPEAVMQEVFIAVLPRLQKVTGGVAGLRTFVFSEAEVLQRIAAQEVADLLNELPDEQREVLLLRLVAGLTVDQVAAVMGRECRCRQTAPVPCIDPAARAVRREGVRGAMTSNASSLIRAIDEMLLDAGVDDAAGLPETLLAVGSLGSLPAPEPGHELAALLSGHAGLGSRLVHRRDSRRQRNRRKSGGGAVTRGAGNP